MWKSSNDKKYKNERFLWNLINSDWPLTVVEDEEAIKPVWLLFTYQFGKCS